MIQVRSVGNYSGERGTWGRGPGKVVREELEEGDVVRSVGSFSGERNWRKGTWEGQWVPPVVWEEPEEGDLVRWWERTGRRGRGKISGFLQGREELEEGDVVRSVGSYSGRRGTGGGRGWSGWRRTMATPPPKDQPHCGARTPSLFPQLGYAQWYTAFYTSITVQDRYVHTLQLYKYSCPQGIFFFLYLITFLVLVRYRQKQTKEKSLIYTYPSLANTHNVNENIRIYIIKWILQLN